MTWGVVPADCSGVGGILEGRRVDSGLPLYVELVSTMDLSFVWGIVTMSFGLAGDSCHYHTP